MTVIMSYTHWCDQSKPDCKKNAVEKCGIQNQCWILHQWTWRSDIIFCRNIVQHPFLFFSLSMLKFEIHTMKIALEGSVQKIAQDLIIINKWMTLFAFPRLSWPAIFWSKMCLWSIQFEKNVFFVEGQLSYPYCTKILHAEN